MKKCSVCDSLMNKEVTTPMNKVAAVSDHRCTDTTCRHPDTQKAARNVWESYKSKARFIKPFKNGKVFRSGNYQFNVFNNDKLVVLDLSRQISITCES